MQELGAETTVEQRWLAYAYVCFLTQSRPAYLPQ